jgi:subtilisin family serine protease
MKKRLVIAGIVVMACMIAQTTAAQPGLVIKAREKAIKGSYIVIFNRGREASTLANELAVLHGGRLKHVYRHALQGAAYEMTAAQAEAMARNPWVASVEEDFELSLVGDQANPPSWGLDRIDQRNLPLNNNYHYDYNGTGVRVYVLDTGIRTTHTNFGGRASWATNCTAEASSDIYGHGTHVAGIIGSATYGVAKNVSLYAVKVCTGVGVDSTCSNSAVICGIDYVTGQKQSNPSIPMVANMSLRGPFSTSENNSVQGSITAGVFYAVAAGNDNGADACSYSPASAPNAFTVGAASSSDVRASFSNIGTCVDIFAPGLGITSTWNTSDSATAVLDGTSMASPHVAGAAALILHENPSWSPYQVTSELAVRASLNKITDPGTGSPNRLLYTLSVPSPVGAPPMPASMTVTQLQCWGLNSVTWSASSGATYYELYRSTSSSYPSQTLEYSGPDTSRTVSVGSLTYLRVRACNSSGCSDYRVGNLPASFFGTC